ncbi:MAG: chitobiase/beta-hexosaminidase C-terminal domain-containing protein, partial [Desulfobacterales bacterium]|nr:chitobiase/beta-hexosaminidase C-terminal domain-containing protein [Desulfobacterales bacterium]
SAPSSAITRDPAFLEAPVFIGSQLPGTYLGVETGTVALTCLTPGFGGIFYTVDGSEPNDTKTPYTVPFELWNSWTPGTYVVKAIAYIGLVAGPVVTGVFTVANAVAPTPHWEYPPGTNISDAGPITVPAGASVVLTGSYGNYSFTANGDPNSGDTFIMPNMFGGSVSLIGIGGGAAGIDPSAPTYAKVTN